MHGRGWRSLCRRYTLGRMGNSENTESAAAGGMSDALRAALWMITACAGFACMTGVIRHISATLPPFEIVFFRNLFGLLALTPWLMRNGVSSLKTDRLGLYSVRAVTGLVAMMTWFWAVSIVPLADATALSFTAPMFATVLAVFFLGETVRLRRWSATLIGFGGAMIILRPGVGELDPALLIVLVSAAAMSMSGIFVKKLTSTESPAKAVAWSGIMMVPLSFIPALLVWQWPTGEAWAWLVGLGVVATGAHVAMNRAISLSELTAILPYDFTRLPFAALVGFLAFGQTPDIWTWVGAAVIFSSSIYIAQREARLKPDDPLPTAAAAGTARPADIGPDVQAGSARGGRKAAE